MLFVSDSRGNPSSSSPSPSDCVLCLGPGRLPPSHQRPRLRLQHPSWTDPTMHRIHCTGICPECEWKPGERTTVSARRARRAATPQDAPQGPGGLRAKPRWAEPPRRSEPPRALSTRRGWRNLHRPTLQADLASLGRQPRLPLDLSGLLMEGQRQKQTQRPRQRQRQKQRQDTDGAREVVPRCLS